MLNDAVIHSHQQTQNKTRNRARSSHAVRQWVATPPRTAQPSALRTEVEVASITNASGFTTRPAVALHYRVPIGPATLKAIDTAISI